MLHFTISQSSVSACIERETIQYTVNTDAALKYLVESWHAVKHFSNKCCFFSRSIGRHSKSIDTNKMCCAYCRGQIVLLPPVNKDGTPAKTRTPNKFAMFVKENYGTAKKTNVGMKHANIMRLLSQDFAQKAKIAEWNHTNRVCIKNVVFLESPESGVQISKSSTCDSFPLIVSHDHDDYDDSDANIHSKSSSQDLCE